MFTQIHVETHFEKSVWVEDARHFIERSKKLCKGNFLIYWKIRPITEVPKLDLTPSIYTWYSASGIRYVSWS